LASLKDLAGDQKPIVGYPKVIKFGPIELQGYMLENGEFRQSVQSTERALGGENSKVVRRLFEPRYKGSTPALGLQAKPSSDQDSEQSTGQKGLQDSPVFVPVVCPGVVGHTGTVYTINLPMVVEVWKQVAMSGGKYAQPALELLGLSAVHSLERTYQEAFGVNDSRSTEDRLLDWAIRLDAGGRFKLFAGDFHKHFARVTGVAIGHPYAKLCLAELVYHRLPEKIYQTLKDINPEDERGWRQFTYSQLMTDEMRQYMREIVAAVTNQLANTPSKSDDPSGYPKLLKRLDVTLPRHTKRGSKPGVQPPQLKEYNFSRNSENSND
jgi:hypothetical protein